MMVSQISRRGWITLVGIPALFVSAYIIALKPALANLPFCAVKLFTGIDCPGCGLTRSIAFLTHGQIRKSIDCHPLGIVIALLLVYIFAVNLIGYLRGRKLSPFLSGKSKNMLLHIFLIALILQWLVKLIFL